MRKVIAKGNLKETLYHSCLMVATFHDANDAWEKALNYIMSGPRKAVKKETVTIKKRIRIYIYSLSFSSFHFFAFY